MVQRWRTKSSPHLLQSLASYLVFTCFSLEWEILAHFVYLISMHRRRVASFRENSIQYDRKVWNLRRVRHRFPVHT